MGKWKRKRNRKRNKACLINNFIIDIPKEKSGEDAPPLLMVLHNKKSYLIGVFDGMGGSGSTLYEENSEIHTGAYLASRETKKAVEEFFIDPIYKKVDFPFAESDIDLLKEKITEKLKEKLGKQQYEQSNIKSNLVRTFPTTMSIGYVSFFNEKTKIKVFWAGDSRIYCLSAGKGLIQLTKDDLKVENDPFQNIKNDSPLSNMVNLDNDFSINFKEIEESTPAILFAATDGCFQFFPTPMHFENMLLQTLQDANTIDEWKENVIKILTKISGDDCSIALICLSDKSMNFVNFKELFRTRNELLYRDFMKKIIDKEKVIAELKKTQEQTEQIVRFETERNELYENLWFKYKKIYYSHF